METKAMLVWLAATVGLFAVAVEMIVRRQRQHLDRHGSEARGPPPSDLIGPEFADRNTPDWMTAVVQTYDPEQLPTLDHVIGMDALQHRVRDLAGAVLTTRQTDTPQPSTAILLHGARGAGKSLLVRALAGQFRARLIHVSARLLIPAANAGSQPLIAAIVRYALTHPPSVLFIDDFEVLAATPAHVARINSTAHDLLSELHRRDRRAQCVVIATVANESFAPSATCRRVFDHIIEVERPDRATRFALLEQVLAQHGMALDDPEAVVELTAGMTPARLIDVIRRACGRAQLEQGPAGTVSVHHVRSTLREPIGPRWVDELALSRQLKTEVEHLVALLADPNASVGVLLAGDAGTGKTTLASCLAMTTGRHVVTVVADSSGRGGVVSAKTLTARAGQARTRRPSVLVIDDERLLGAAATSSQSADGPAPTSDVVRAEIDRALATPGVAVIATARRFDQVDRDLRVPRRLGREIWLPRPDESARLRLLRKHLRTVRLRDVSLEVLADELTGYTPATLQTMINEAIRSAERRVIAATRGQWSTEPTVTPVDIWRARQMISQAHAVGPDETAS